jgi:hypothetical protein
MPVLAKRPGAFLAGWLRAAYTLSRKIRTPSASRLHAIRFRLYLPHPLPQADAGGAAR